MSKKRIISVILLLSFIFTNFSILVSAENTLTELDITAGSITIDSDGAYKISGNGTETSNTITVSEGVTAEITLDKVVIKGASPMKITNGAKVTLYLSGDNVLTASTKNNAGLAVTRKTDGMSELIINDSGNGDGTLTATGNNNSAGIGGTYNTAVGNITINSGTVTGISNHTGAGIGAGYGADSKESVITITGGTVIGKGNDSYSSGIGGARNKTFGNVVITGGYVEATGVTGIGGGKSGTISNIIIDGGSVNATLAKDAVNSHDDAVSKVVLKMPDETENTDVTVMNEYGETWETTVDGEGKIYQYVSENIQNAVVRDSNDVLYWVAIDLDNITDTVELEKYEGDDCSCTDETASVTLTIPGLSSPYSLSVDKVTKQARVKLSSTFKKADDCTYPIHGSIPNYTIKDEDGTEVSEDYAKIENGYLTVTDQAVGTDLYITSTMTQEGVSYTSDEMVVSVVINDKMRYNLSNGSIVITDSTTDNTMHSITVGSDAAQSVPKSEPIYIYQSGTSAIANTIQVKAEDVNVVIQSLNIETRSTTPIDIRSSSHLTLTLEGDNSLKTLTQAAAISGENASGSSLTINGNGSLSSISNTGAGIGGVETITIDSGTIYAEGGRGGAGIGGKSDGSGKTVVINGGRVKAHGSDTAAGIGGGNTKYGIGGNVTINGGRVIAESDSGVGIGAGLDTISHGTLTINGGSVRGKLGPAAKNGAGTTLYLNEVKIEDVTGEHDVEYTVGDEDEPKISTATDEYGKLYLYMPGGRNWVRVYKDDVTYYRFIQTQSSQVNTGTCQAKPVAEIESFRISGQIGETEYTTEDEKNIIKVTVPYNIVLSQITPVIDAGDSADYYIVGNSDFSAPVTYEVMAHDKHTVSYEVRVAVDESGDDGQPTVFDISEGSVIFMSDYIEYAGTGYKLNENGYIIIGETDEYNIFVDEGSSEAPVDIILRDAKITSTSGAYPLEIYRNTNIILEGENELKSVSYGSEAIHVENAADECVLSISGDGSLTVKGGDRASGIVLVDATANITTEGNIIIAGGNQEPSISGGDFITDSTSNIRLIDSPGTVRTPAMDDEGNDLYQVVITINGTLPEDAKIEYSGKEYDPDDSNSIYLMLPDGEVSLELTYGNDLYLGGATVEGHDTTLIAEHIYIEGVDYDETLTFRGGDIEFTFNGYLAKDRVKIKLVPTDPEKDTLEEVAVIEGDGKYRAKVSIEGNDSHDKSIVYKVYYEIIVNKEKSYEYLAGPDIVVPRNNTICRIIGFTLPNQLGKTSIDDAATTDRDGNEVGRVIINFPYDYNLVPNNYSPEINIIGKMIIPQSGYAQWFSQASGDSLKSEYEVTAHDMTTKRKYEVSLRKESTPHIDSLTFTNPKTYEGGRVVIKLYGTALSHIENAYNLNNRVVTVSADGLKTETAVPVEGEDYYVVTMSVPGHDDVDSAKTYQLTVKIGSTEQTIRNSSVITVPRKAKSETGMKMTIDGQLGETVYESGNDDSVNNIRITMPYDADITQIAPNINLTDKNAVCSPLSYQDFSESNVKPIKYTVTAEDQITKKEYRVYVTKQKTPVAESLEFSNPGTSAAGRIRVKVNGKYLENAANAMNRSKDIAVLVSPSDGVTEGNAELDTSTGDFYATIFIPQNDDYDNSKSYTLSVKIGGEEQQLEEEAILTVPRKRHNQKELTEITIVDTQTMDSVISGLNLNAYVPYNTDLGHLTKEPLVSHTGVRYEPSGIQNFNKPVKYTIYAENGSTNVYTVNVIRNGVAGVSSISFNKPRNFADTDITVDIEGNFIPFIDEEAEENGTYKDKLEISAKDQYGNVIDGTIDYDGYSGKATGTLELPENEALDEDYIYQIIITINGIEQSLGVNSQIVVPRRKSREILSFRVNNQVGSTDINYIDDIIKFEMPYETDLRDLLPYLEIDGDEYSPVGSQSFLTAQTYTVDADSDAPRPYEVNAIRNGLPTISSVDISGVPETYQGKTVTVDVDGIFFDSLKIKAIPEDGTETIESDTIELKTPDDWYEATATLDIPTNYDEAEDRVYNLEFEIDGYEDIKYNPAQKIVVPRRKTKEITKFSVNNQVGKTRIDKDNDEIFVLVEYPTHIQNLITSLQYDGDDYTIIDPLSDGNDSAAKGIANFDNETKSLVYSISAETDPEVRNYTVHVARSGEPSLSKVSFIPELADFSGGVVDIDILGIFFENAEVTAVNKLTGEVIKGNTYKFDDEHCKVTVDIPTNYDTENEQVYSLRFNMDGFSNTPYAGNTEITVPRRTTREITKFELPDIQEGPTVIEKTEIKGEMDIKIDVPYHLDISSVVPEIIYDAQEISPAADEALDFSDLKNPVKYTLTSDSDEPIKYTVKITRIGEDPYLKSVTVENQVGETTYDEETDVYSIVLPSSAKLDEVEPILDYVGEGYYVGEKGNTGPQDFTDSKTEPLVYTFYNKYGIETKYNISITKRRGGKSRQTATPSPVPTASPSAGDTEPTEAPVTPTATQEPLLISNTAYISGYEENSAMLFKPDNNITRAEVTKILSVLDESYDENTDYGDVFNDVPTYAWYRNYVNFAAQQGYISGYDDGTSRPEQMITRAEFVSMLARYAGLETDYDVEDVFNDISRFEWCKHEINTFAQMGILSGYSDGSFLPDNLITRAEAVSMINRILGRNANDDEMDNIENPFSDVPDTHWAYDAILLASCEY